MTHALPEHFVDSRDFARIARSIRYLDEHFREQPRLQTVAAHAGLSEFHFNRLFRRWAGVTPKQYLSAVTGAAARAALKGERSVLGAAFEVGLSGPGRLHDLVVSLHAMTPGEIKAQGHGTSVRYGFSSTPFGRAIFGSTSRGVFHLGFVDAGQEAAAIEALEAAAPRARFERDDEAARDLALTIWGARAGRANTLHLHVTGTNFQLKVWQALIHLGSREHTTYSALADVIGSKRGMRAVGGAVGANPVAWLIPCHHVLRKSGALGGYHWGEDRKRAMLAWESVPKEINSANASAVAAAR